MDDDYPGLAILQLLLAPDLVGLTIKLGRALCCRQGFFLCNFLEGPGGGRAATLPMYFGVGWAEDWLSGLHPRPLRASATLE